MTPKHNIAEAIIEVAERFGVPIAEQAGPIRPPVRPVGRLVVERNAVDGDRVFFVCGDHTHELDGDPIIQIVDQSSSSSATYRLSGVSSAPTTSPRVRRMTDQQASELYASDGVTPPTREELDRAAQQVWAEIDATAD